MPLIFIVQNDHKLPFKFCQQPALDKGCLINKHFTLQLTLSLKTFNGNWWYEIYQGLTQTDELGDCAQIKGLKKSQC